MKPNTEIPKMEPFLSTEERMHLIVNILKEFREQKIKSPEFIDLYHLNNGELTALLNVLSSNSNTVNNNNDEDESPIYDDVFSDVDRDPSWDDNGWVENYRGLRRTANDNPIIDNGPFPF